MFSKLYSILILYWISLCIISSLSAELSLYDFTTDANVSDWSEQSDTVRSVGMSKAALVLHQNTGYRRAVFFALLNRQSDGSAFAGYRAFPNFNLTGYTNMTIQCRGQGAYLGYKIVLRHKGQVSEPYYTFEQYFQAPATNFSVVTLPLSGFTAYYRGQSMTNETLDVSQITSVGIQMYGGVYRSVNQSGPGTLEIDWIKAI